MGRGHTKHASRRANPSFLALFCDAPDLKILFTSGYSAEFMDQDLGLESGVNFLQKPYELGALLAIVRRALQRETERMTVL